MKITPIQYTKALKRTATVLEIVDNNIFFSYENNIPFRTYPGKQIEYVLNGIVHVGTYDEITSDDGAEIRTLLRLEDSSHLIVGDTIDVYDTFQAKKDNDVVTLQDITEQLSPESPKIGLKDKKISIVSSGKPGLVSNVEKSKLDRTNIFVVNDVDTPVNNIFQEIITLKFDPDKIYEVQIKKGSEIFDGLIIFTHNGAHQGVVVSARHVSLDTVNNLNLKFVKHNFDVNGKTESYVKVWAKIEPADTVVNYRFGFGIPSLKSITFPTTPEVDNSTLLFNTNHVSIVLDRYLLSGDLNNINRIVTPDDLTSAATLDGEITAMVGGGAVEVGDKFANKLTFSDYVRQVWTKIFYPTFTNPSVSLTVTGLGSTVEAGAIADITLTVNFSRGQIRGKLVGGLWNAGAQQDFRSGVATKYIINGNQPEVGQELVNTLVIPGFQVQDGSNILNALVEYLAGPQPLDSQNKNYNAPLASGDVNTTRTLYGRRQAFYGTVPNLDPVDTSDKVRALQNSIMNPVNGSTFRIPIPAGTAQVIFAYEATLRDVNSVKYVEGLGAPVKANFVKATIQVAGSNNFAPRSYKIYIYTPVGPFDSAVNYDVTI